MKTAIYNFNGEKIAGDDGIVSSIPQRILNAQLPLIEQGILYTKLSDGNISAISADEKVLEVFLNKKPENKRITKNEFIRNLLFGAEGNDIKKQCAKYGFVFEEIRRVYVAELNEDISSYVQTLEEIFENDDINVINIDGQRIAVICSETENDAEEMAGAIGATFAEINVDYNIGVSCIADNALQLENAFDQALAAIRIGRMLAYGGGVWFYSNILPELIISGLPNEAVNSLKEKAEKVSKSLDSETIQIAQEFFKHNLNISETARFCYLHRNTLIYKLDKIQKETGFNMRNFDEAVALRIYIAANKVLR